MRNSGDTAVPSSLFSAWNPLFEVKRYDCLLIIIRLRGRIPSILFPELYKEHLREVSIKD
jgi:hypothetical protein